MTSSIAVRHKMETAHRLPFLGGRCTNIHGHSWQLEWTFTGPLDQAGILTDFGPLKKWLHSWVDAHLDHGAMLGATDTLLGAFINEGSKVFTFGSDDLARDLPWPTVEAVAILLRRVADAALFDVGIYTATCTRVVVTETRDNTAMWSDQ